MKFPYGSCDFDKIVTQGYFYADRTDLIPLIEEAGDHLLFPHASVIIRYYRALQQIFQPK
ncbi:MAG: hypothetical protein DRI57_26510 [Deltaproteobacteria bacterium]|nr:MAG: hypothetical protein DRI57_26510 [Deltaproteobacteria bacterium]